MAQEQLAGFRICNLRNALSTARHALLRFLAFHCLLCNLLHLTGDFLPSSPPPGLTAQAHPGLSGFLPILSYENGEFLK
jgi:hypothetical protein